MLPFPIPYFSDMLVFYCNKRGRMSTHRNALSRMYSGGLGHNHRSHTSRHYRKLPKFRQVINHLTFNFLICEIKIIIAPES